MQYVSVFFLRVADIDSAKYIASFLDILPSIYQATDHPYLLKHEAYM